MPTLNSSRTLRECLESIAFQDYPPELVEIVVADGGSVDGTQEIAKEFGAMIAANGLRTGEAGKAVALARATNDLVALIDSDNVLPQSDWLRRMVDPMTKDDSIMGSEPWGFTYRASDPAWVRYAAMLGMNDPLCHFLGNYDRFNMLTGRWTSLPVACEDRGRYLILTLEPPRMPTIGANGTILRRELLSPWMGKDYFFDIDVIHDLAELNHRRFAKVKIGIVHLSGADLRTFARKQRRRARDYFYFRGSTARSYDWNRQPATGILKFVVANLTLVPLLWQSIVGIRRSKDMAWLLHPIACLLTLVTYASETVRAQVQTSPASRSRWQL